MIVDRGRTFRTTCGGFVINREAGVAEEAVLRGAYCLNCSNGGITLTPMIANYK